MFSYFLLKKKLKLLNKKLDEIKNIQIEESMKIKNLIILASNPNLNIQEAHKKIYKSYPRATGFLADVQTCNLLLMKELMNICKQLNIKFWLHAGTLIGAIRHSGFIPWDDDVDVGMTITDFEKLKMYLEKNSTNLILNEYYNQITCSRQYQLKFNNSLPIFIDIVKYVPCNARTSEEKAKFLKKIKKTNKELLHKYTDELHSPKIIDIGYYMLGKYEGKTKERVDKIIDSANEKLKEKNLIEKPSWYYALENYPFAYPILNNEEMFPLKLTKFEDTEFYIPNCPEKYLAGYGNIWDLPKDIGKTPHLYAFINKKIQIEEFIKENRV